MNIKLQSLALHNFKGVRELALTLNGRDATIYGANGAGKTTIADAFLWLLFDKDSENRGQFEVKTLDASNQPIHNLEHEVEAELSVDGRRLVLRKLYKEVWKRTRGKPQQEFAGHTTDYWVDDVPHKAKEYADYVSGLIGDEQFRLITNPLYFSTKLHWEARRKILLELCGEISADAVIAAAGEPLEGLAELLGDRTIDAARKVLQSQRRRVNDDLEKIPAQIEAVTRTLPEILNDYTDVEAALAACREEVADLDAQMQDASRALEPIREKGRRLGELEREQAALAARLVREARSGYEDALQNRQRQDEQIRRQDVIIEGIRANLGRMKVKLLDADVELRNLRAEHEREYQTAFSEPPAGEYVCRSCGQDLPAGKRAELLIAAKERFETQKDANLKTITYKGLGAKEAYEELTAEIANADKDLDNAIKGRESMIASRDAFKLAEENLAPSGEVDYAADPQYAALGAQIAALRAELEATPADTTSGIAEQRAAVNSRVAGHMKTLSERDAAVHSRAVIAEYTSRERQLSDQLIELDGQLYMLETYVRTEAELLESSVNSKFKTISFRLFKEQINGGLQPTCEAVVGGVQFSEANTAGQYNSGMEIIDALCGHYGAYAPVFVDRCESINHLAPIASQVIRMVVATDNDMAIASGLPGAVSARAARNDICIQTENKKQEVA